MSKYNIEQLKKGIEHLETYLNKEFHNIGGTIENFMPLKYEWNYKDIYNETLLKLQLANVRKEKLFYYLEILQKAEKQKRQYVLLKDTDPKIQNIWKKENEILKQLYGY